MEIDPKIMAGLRRVEESKKTFLNLRGANPSCKNKVGTMFCQRCGRNMKKSRRRGPCKAVPRSQRWSAVCDNGEIS